MAEPLDGRPGDTVKLWDVYATPIDDVQSQPVFVPASRSGGRKLRLGYFFGTAPATVVLVFQQSDDNVTYSTLASFTNINGESVDVVADGYVRVALTTLTGSPANLTAYVTLDPPAEGTELPFQLASRLDLSGIDVAAGDTDGFAVFAGTSGQPIDSLAVAGKFDSSYFTSAAVSGSIEGVYTRSFATGAGSATLGALRAFATVSDVTIGNARGGHISLSFGATAGKITGLGAALETTLHIANAASGSGTMTSLNVAINSDGASSDPAGATDLSFIRISNQGDATGGADVDDDAAVLSLAGFTQGTGNVFKTGADVAAAATLRVKVNGVAYYLLLGTTEAG